MITIDQLLESVDLDFEPRFVTKDESGWIKFFSDMPRKFGGQWVCDYEVKVQSIYPIKISDFANKKWQECIYEVPRKATDEIEKLGKLNVSGTNMTMNQSVVDRVVNTLNQVIEAVNELKGGKNE